MPKRLVEVVTWDKPGTVTNHAVFSARGLRIDVNADADEGGMIYRKVNPADLKGSGAMRYDLKRPRVKCN